jgi:hypothetical protein
VELSSRNHHPCGFNSARQTGSLIVGAARPSLVPKAAHVDLTDEGSAEKQGSARLFAAFKKKFVAKGTISGGQLTSR